MIVAAILYALLVVLQRSMVAHPIILRGAGVMSFIMGLCLPLGQLYRRRAARW
jgi:uncharacterized membrane protein YccC